MMIRHCISQVACEGRKVPLPVHIYNNQCCKDTALCVASGKVQKKPIVQLHFTQCCASRFQVLAYNYMADVLGIASEEAYPYRGISDYCHKDIPHAAKFSNVRVQLAIFHPFPNTVKWHLCRNVENCTLSRVLYRRSPLLCREYCWCSCGSIYA